MGSGERSRLGRCPNAPDRCVESSRDELEKDKLKIDRRKIMKLEMRENVVISANNFERKQRFN
jgi:hypothetical protein